MKPDRELLFETQYWKIELRPEQLYLGRCRVELKRKCGDLADLTKEEILDFFEIVKKLENLLRKTFNATMFNWTCLMNNAFEENSDESSQVHWHFRPRYKNPVEFNDEVFKEPNFGHHYIRERDKEKIVSREMLKAINAKLQENLNNM